MKLREHASWAEMPLLTVAPPSQPFFTRLALHESLTS